MEEKLTKSFDRKVNAKFIDCRECPLTDTEVRVLYTVDDKNKFKQFTLVIPKYGALHFDYKEFKDALKGMKNE